MVRKSGGNGEIFECNVTRPGDVQKMADDVFSSWRRVELLINNAGVVSCGFVGDIPLADWKWCADINLWACSTAATVLFLS